MLTMATLTRGASTVTHDVNGALATVTHEFIPKTTNWYILLGVLCGLSVLVFVVYGLPVIYGLKKTFTNRSL